MILFNKSTTIKLSALSFLLLFNTYSMADSVANNKQSKSIKTINASHTSTSINGFKKDLKTEEAIAQLKVKQLQPMLPTNKALITKKTGISKDVNNSTTLASSLLHLNQYEYDFSIYQATAILLEDNDADGYYQTFQISFDADLISYSIFDQADVYAELYLSFNGGPWEYYLTTDIFTLYGESSDDQYDIYTILNQGYISGEYDVLIDLYEVGFSDIVASYSGFDTASLAALPLESDEYDHVYVEQYHTDIHHHGGSMSLYVLSFIILLIILRFLTITRKKH